MSERRVRADRVQGWLPQAFEDARIDRGLTYAEVRARLGDSPPALSTVYGWGRGVAPHRSLLPAIARALRVRQKDLTR